MGIFIFNSTWGDSNMFAQKCTTLVLLGLASSVLGTGTGCNHNNCYRAFNGDAYAAEAKSFCSTFTTATKDDLDGLPTHAAKKCSQAELSVEFGLDWNGMDSVR